MGMWEAWNREDVAAFGWSAKEVAEKAKEKVKLTDHKSPDVDVEAQRHSPYEESISDQEFGRNDPHDINTKNSKRPQFQDNAEASAKSSNISSPSFPGALPPQLHKKWVWFSLDTKYFHELGFLGAFFQLCGATIFWISGYGFWKILQFIQEVCSHIRVDSQQYPRFCPHWKTTPLLSMARSGHHK